MSSFSNEGIDKLLKILNTAAKQLSPINTAFPELYKKTRDSRLPMIMDNLAEVLVHLDQAAQQINALRDPSQVAQIAAVPNEILEETKEYIVKDTKVPWLKLISNKEPDKDQEP